MKRTFTRTSMADAFIKVAKKKMSKEGKNFDEEVTQRIKNKKTALTIHNFIKKEVVSNDSVSNR